MSDQQVDYNSRLATVYQQGRALTPAQERVWQQTVTRHLPSKRPLRGVEVGSGTGRFTPLLAQWFGGPILGIEPFEKMCEQAEQHAAHAQVTYLRGQAENLPLKSDWADFALLFLVWHHVQDKEKAAAELYRVLRPDGTLLLRAKFSDHLPIHWWLDAFPDGVETDAAGFETLAEVRATFMHAGFQEVAFETVGQPASGTRREVLERLKLRSLSVFERMTEEQLTTGFRNLEARVQANPDEAVPDNPATLLVLRKPVL